MKSGKCPKCESANVYSRKPTAIRGGAELVFLGPFTRSLPEVYVCTECGYMEKYITKKRDLRKVERKWEKV